MIRDAHKTLPAGLREPFFASLAELEDNECHRRRSFPRTRLHRVTGIEQAVYRADITKFSGWRLHVQYAGDDTLDLIDLIEAGEHDDVVGIVKAKKHRYTKPGS